VILRIGDSSYNTTNVPPGRALPTFWDFYDVNPKDVTPAEKKRPYRTISMPGSTTAMRGVTQALPGHQPCTLSYGYSTDTKTPNNNATAILWFFETEGLVSSSLDRKMAIFPCHTSPVGTRMEGVLSDAKTIGILNGNLTVDTRILFSGFTGVRGTATGLRQAVTINGGEFWLAGIANFEYGIRFLSSPRATRSTRILGQTVYPDGHY